MINNKENNLLTEYVELRRHAEKQLKSRASEVGFSRADDGTQRLLHELQVHQIELEMQNTELRQTRDELETALEKYIDLYNFTSDSTTARNQA